VLGEAMAACLPIVTTAVGAHAEAVENERTGFIVPTDDAAITCQILVFIAGG